jgi:hypothetical protein
LIIETGISVFEELVNEAFEREQEIVDIDPQSLGHVYVFKDDKGVSVEICVTEKLDNKSVDIKGKMSAETPLIEILALMHGTCYLEFEGRFVPTSNLGMYGIHWEQIEKIFMTELEKKNRTEEKKRLRDVIYGKVMCIEEPDYKSLRQVLKSDGILKEKYLGRRKDPLIQELMTFFEELSKINEITKKNQIEYKEEQVKELKEKILNAIGNRINYQEYGDEEHNVNLPNMVLRYDFVDGGIKLERAYFGKDSQMHNVKGILKLTEAEKKLLALAKTIEVRDMLATTTPYSLVFDVNMGKPPEFHYYLHSSGVIGFTERETARNLMNKLFPNFAYSNVETVKLIYEHPHGSTG